MLGDTKFLGVLSPFDSGSIFFFPWFVTPWFLPSSNLAAMVFHLTLILTSIRGHFLILVEVAVELWGLSMICSTTTKRRLEDQLQFKSGIQPIKVLCNNKKRPEQ